MFEEMRAEESQHRAWLIGRFRQRFGEHIRLIPRRLPDGRQSGQDRLFWLSVVFRASPFRQQAFIRPSPFARK